MSEVGRLFIKITQVNADTSKMLTDAQTDGRCDYYRAQLANRAQMKAVKTNPYT